MRPKVELAQWYKQLYELKPERSLTTTQLRWDIAYALYRFQVPPNFLTAAHLILNKSWSNDQHVPALQTLAARMAELPQLSDKKTFITTFNQFFSNQGSEDEEELFDGNCF